MTIDHDLITEPSWVRLTALEGTEAAVELAIGATIAQVLPGLRAEDGFRRLVALKSADWRRATVLTFWDRAAAVAEGGVGAFRGRAAQLGVSITETDLLELVAQEPVE